MLKKKLDKEAWGALSEEMQNLYEERDGEYHLRLPDGVVTREDLEATVNREVAGLKQKNTELLDELKPLKAQMAAIEDMGGLDSLKEIVEGHQRQKDEDLLKKGDVDAIVAQRTEQLTKQHEKAVAKLTEGAESLQNENKQLREELSKLKIDNAVANALAAKVEKVPAAARKLALVEARAMMTVNKDGEIEARDAEGNPRVAFDEHGKQRQYGPEDFVSEFIEAYQADFWPSKGGGAPKDPGQGGAASNPWKKDSFNLTEQGRIKRENPDKARRLAKEAGITPAW